MKVEDNNVVYERGDVIWVDISNRGGSIQKGIRRAVVISNYLNNKYSNTIHVIPCTTRISKNKFRLHVLRDNQYELILCEQVQIINKFEIMMERDISKVSKREMEEIESCLKIQFDLNN